MSYSSHYWVYNPVTFQPWVSVYAVPPHGVLSPSRSRKSSTKEVPAKRCSWSKRLVRAFICMCVHCLCGCRCDKQKEGIIQEVNWKGDSIGWVCVGVFLITVLTLSRPSSRTIGKYIKSPPIPGLPDIGNQLTVGTKYGAHSIFTGDRDWIVLITHPSRTCVASLK